MKHLRAALEDGNEQVLEGGLEDGSEYEIARVSQDADAEFEDEQTLSAVMENLNSYAMCIESLIETNACTPATLMTLKLGIEQQLDRIHAPINTVSLEAYGEDIVRQHEIALEGIRYFIQKYAQAVVVSIKHRLNAIGDFFRTTKSQINKYRTKLDETESEYLSERKEWSNHVHEGSLVELWYHFATGEGQAKNVLQEVTHDLAFSSYVLKGYSSDIVATMGKLSSILRSAKLDTTQGAEKVFRDVERLPSGGSLFNQRYIGGHPFLSVTGVTMKRGDRRKVVEVDGTQFHKLAELATPYTAVEVGQWTHTAKKIGANFGGHIGIAANYVLSAKIEMSTDDIGKLIKMGHNYLDNVEEYLDNGRRFLNEASTVAQSLTKAGDTMGDKLSGSEMAQITAGVKQVTQYLFNLVHCYQNPAKAEIARSIKGAKYNMYLALRMIANAR